MKDSKSTKERQKEIIEAARELFFTKGYEATSTVDIMKAVGIAKGTLYYHFASKEEILDALIESITDKMAMQARAVRNNKNLSVVERMVGIIGATTVEELQDGSVVAALHLPQNALLHQKSYSLMIEKLSPIMLEVVMEGIEEGIFETDFPKAAVHMAMTYSLSAFDDNETEPELFRGFIYNLERLLGTKKGCLDNFLNLF